MLFFVRSFGRSGTCLTKGRKRKKRQSRTDSREGDPPQQTTDLGKKKDLLEHPIAFSRLIRESSEAFPPQQPNLKVGSLFEVI